MKKIALFVFVFLASLQCYAQRGFYVKPTFGVGYSNLYSSIGTEQFKGGFAYSLGLGLGYKVNHVRLETGVNYVSPGGSRNHYRFMEDLDWGQGGDVVYAKSYTNIKQTDHYLMVPLKIGYEAVIGKKLSLVPAIGAEMAFDLGGSYKGERFDLNDTKLYDVKGRFENDKPRLVGSLGLHLEYRFNHNMHFFAGPTARYFMNNAFSYLHSSSVNLMPHILTMDMGVLCRF